MQIRPILATLRKHRLTATLLTLQVAFTCAIVTNVAFMIVQRVQRISIPTGLDENALSVIHVTGIGKDVNPWARHRADLTRLRTIPGVQSAVAVSFSLPLNQNESDYGTCATQAALDRAMQAMSMEDTGCVSPSMYDGSPGLVHTLGLELVAGRDFQPDEYVTGQKHVPVAIISRALADQLYPGEHALGKVMHVGPNPVRVIGIVKTLLAPNLRQPATRYYTMIWPQLPAGAGVDYVLRSAPRDRQRVLDAARALLLQADPGRIIDPKRMRTYSQIRSRYFRRDTTMIVLLVAAGLGLLFVTALGIAGLANFWVQQRTRSIGIRRAVGATRADILHYFQTENFLIVGGGVVVGVLLALGLNLLLMRHYELPRLPLWYLAIGAAALWLLGQLAVLAPALRASRVQPVVATRSV